MRLSGESPALIHRFLEFCQIALRGAKLFHIVRGILKSPCLKKFERRGIDGTIGHDMRARLAWSRL